MYQASRVQISFEIIVLSRAANNPSDLTITEKALTRSIRFYRAFSLLKAVNKDNQFYYQNGRENFIIITTARYNESPLVIRGHGAGAEVTAAGVLGDILKC